jgi:chromosomal replication initiator protein
VQVTTSERVVAALEQAIAQRIGEPRYQLWFLNKTKFTWHNEHLIVGVPNHFYQEWLQKQYGEAVRGAASAVAGQQVTVKFAIDPELFQAARRDEAAGRRAGPAAAAPQPAGSALPEGAPGSGDKSRSMPRAQPRSRRWHHLDSFVVGSCNRVAHAAALSAVDACSLEANPLVLHGPVGTGKTHLLEGIYAGWRKRHSGWRVVFCTAEDFTNRFLQAMRSGKLAGVRKHFRDCDALLVDDLHFLANKPATQEEFLHTFDVLQAESRPVVVSCDCHPRLAEIFLPELCDRLLGGAIWGLAQPDQHTRVELLKARAARLEVSIAEPVLRFVAEQLRGNVRELEGALHNVLHYAKVIGRPVDLSLAREALGDLLRHVVRVIRLEDVNRAVCKVLRLEAGALQSKEKGWSQAHPRMLAVYMARKHTAATYSEAGAYFGGRNHSTAVAAEKKVRQWVQKDGSMALGQHSLRVREVLERIDRELMQ